ncbi:MAG: acyl carrier protein [Verrucomicrobiaceae bacterium]|nr:acyl carrier protein [Verrucomicrobiaceae bacterium]NCF93763.1 acyl carrier protein [Verrucomicrobiaceae bacterium]
MSINTPPTAREIQDWFLPKLANALDLPIEEIELDTSFAEYGLDSSVALGLTGELSDWLQAPLEATTLWDYPNIKTLAASLARLEAESSG